MISCVASHPQTSRAVTTWRVVTVLAALTCGWPAAGCRTPISPYLANLRKCPRAPRQLKPHQLPIFSLIIIRSSSSSSGVRQAEGEGGAAGLVVWQIKCPGTLTNWTVIDDAPDRAEREIDKSQPVLGARLRLMPLPDTLWRLEICRSARICRFLAVKRCLCCNFINIYLP